MGIRLTASAAEDEETMRGLFASENCPHPRRWSGTPGQTYDRHGHGYHKILFCLSGSITFQDAEHLNYRMGPHDRIDIEPGTEHAATAGPDGVECLESYR